MSISKHLGNSEKNREENRIILKPFYPGAHGTVSPLDV